MICMDYNFMDFHFIYFKFWCRNVGCRIVVNHASLQSLAPFKVVHLPTFSSSFFHEKKCHAQTHSLPPIHRRHHTPTHPHTHPYTVLLLLTLDNKLFLSPQCDQMKEQQVAKFSPKFSQKVATSYFIQIVTLLKWPKKFQDIWSIIAGKIVSNTFQK